MFWKKLCSIIICFWYQVLSSSFCCNKCDIPMFSHSFISFFKNCIIYQLKKVFFKVILWFFLRSAFISIYGFSQAFRLNLFPLWTFFKTNPWFNGCFKFLMWITFHFYHASLLQAFSTLKFFMKLSLNWEVSSIQPKFFVEAFTILPKHKGYLYPNIEDMAILYFYHNLSSTCY